MTPFDYSQIPEDDLKLLKVGLQAIILEAEGECHLPDVPEIEACHILLEKIEADCKSCGNHNLAIVICNSCGEEIQRSDALCGACYRDKEAEYIGNIESKNAQRASKDLRQIERFAKDRIAEITTADEFEHLVSSIFNRREIHNSYKDGIDTDLDGLSFLKG